jgi:hypothetical protein
MTVAIGTSTLGRSEIVTDTDTFTEPGVVYQLKLKLDRPAEDDIDNLVRAIMSIKREYPAISITYVEASGDMVTVEMYDHPAVPIALLIIAVAVAIASIAFAVATTEIRKIFDQIPEEFKGPVAILAGVAVVGTVGWLGLREWNKRK